MQYSFSGGYGLASYAGDPSMSVVPGIDQYATNYLFIAERTNGFSFNSYIAVTVERSAASGLRLDGARLQIVEKTSEVDPLANYVVLTARVSPGQHRLSHTNNNTKFGVLVYGFAGYLGYSYTAGMTFPAVAYKDVPKCQQGRTECLANGTSRCTSCVNPYISEGWGTGCRLPRCIPSCKNNGTCFADDFCNCPSGYFGKSCELGGDLGSYLLPHLNPVNTYGIQQRTSWYDRPEFDPSGRVCFIKIGIKNASPELLMTAISYSATDELYGNFTTGPVDSVARLNQTDRVACLQFRCASEMFATSTVSKIEIVPATSSQSCVLRYQNKRMNITVEALHSQEKLKLHIEADKNYGTSYGIYITMGTRKTAKFIAQRNCLSGHLFGVSASIDPLLNVAATYQCT